MCKKQLWRNLFFERTQSQYTQLLEKNSFTDVEEVSVTVLSNYSCEKFLHIKFHQKTFNCLFLNIKFETKIFLFFIISWSKFFFVAIKNAAVFQKNKIIYLNFFVLENYRRCRNLVFMIYLIVFQNEQDLLREGQSNARWYLVVQRSVETPEPFVRLFWHLWTDFTYCSGVSIVDSEQVNTGWKKE